LNIQLIKHMLQENYNINNIDFIEKIKNVYKICVNKKQYCLKTIKYEYGHFAFIIAAIEHLQKKGFKNTPKIIKTKNNKNYIKIGSKYCYLTEWIIARECNYDNPIDIMLATEKLAQLHIKSRGFKVENYMKPRIGWFKWIETYKTRKNEILDFKYRICNKKVKSEFDIIYLKEIEKELKRADRSILNLINSEYIRKMKEDIYLKEFCHHDYAHHNILINKEKELNIIDFDYCILDSHLHDLCSLLIRVMKNGKWSIENANLILKKYDIINKLKYIDIPIMAAFMEFPQDYWQIGIQYYWEKQPWTEEFFIKKLNRIYDDKEEKQEFIDEFRCCKL
jgi:CotS family spore coat protein